MYKKDEKGVGRKPPDNSADEIERCVLCGRATGYLRSEPIDLRQYYIEGAGQLCKKCFLTLAAEAYDN